MGHIDYSLEVNAWLRQWWLQVARYLKGKLPDLRNLLCNCDKHGLGGPTRVTWEVLKAEINVCDKNFEKQKKTGIHRRHAF